MLLRLIFYDIKVKCKKGKNMFLADTLSKAPFPETSHKEVQEIMVYKVAISDGKLQQFRQQTTAELSNLVTTTLEGWPAERSEVSEDVKPYWTFREELDYVDGAVYRSERVVIPPSLRKYALDCIHSSHMGKEKCKLRARDSCFWL